MEVFDSLDSDISPRQYSVVDEEVKSVEQVTLIHEENKKFKLYFLVKNFVLSVQTRVISGGDKVKVFQGDRFMQFSQAYGSSINEDI